MEILKRFSFVLIPLLFLGCHSVDNGAVKINKPNIVYILCDDLGYGEIQKLNPERGKIKTPCIDQLAMEGLIFTDAHSGSSVCTPTRYGVLTGRYAWRTKLQRGIMQDGDDCLIARGRLTVGQLLQQQGYHTAMVGKWHLNYKYDCDNALRQKKNVNKRANKKFSANVPMGTRIVDGPIDRGFDYFFGFHHTKTQHTIVENNRVLKEIPFIDMLPQLTEKSCEYIRQRAAEARQGSPFFLYVPLNSPHSPVTPSKAWQGKSGLNDHADFVMETDWSVGQIMKTLKEQGLDQNTLVIFTSDNGTSGGTSKMSQLIKKGHYSSHVFRGAKADIWDGGHRVPFIVKWPAFGVKSGSKSDQLICHTDFIATCADLLGQALPDTAAEDSVSFLPALKGENIPLQREAVVHHSFNGRFAIRQGDWKLCFCSGSGSWNSPGDDETAKMGLPPIQLYNLKTGIDEKQNLYTKHPDKVKELTQLMNRIVEAGRSTPGASQKNDVPIDFLKAKK